MVVDLRHVGTTAFNNHGQVEVEIVVEDLC